MGLLLFIVLCATPLVVVHAYPDHHHESVLLSQVKSLVLKAGHMTQGRRGPPVEQLKCVGGACADDAALPRVMQCENKGFDGKDATWACTATLPLGYHLESTDVSCEGFTHPDDPYILVGSCGVEYVIRGSKPQPPQPPAPQPQPRFEPQPQVFQYVHQPTPPPKQADLDPTSVVIVACLVGIFCTMVMIAICTETRPASSSAQHQQPVHVIHAPPPVYNYAPPPPPPYVAPTVIHSHHHHGYGGGGYTSGFVDATVLNAATSRPRYRSPSPIRYSAPVAPAPAPVAPVATSAPSTGFGKTKRR